jgi:hypothetical protein
MLLNQLLTYQVVLNYNYLQWCNKGYFHSSRVHKFISNTTSTNLVNDVDIFLLAQSVIINLNKRVGPNFGVAIIVLENK